MEWPPIEENITKIEILTPIAGEAVPWQHRIYGSRPGSGVPILVYVLSRDSRWYQQGDVEFRGKLWQCHVQFGTLGAPSGTAYHIVALVPDGRFKGTSPGDSLETLPADIEQTDAAIVVRA